MVRQCKSIVWEECLIPLTVLLPCELLESFREVFSNFLATVCECVNKLIDGIGVELAVDVARFLQKSGLHGQVVEVAERFLQSF